jgi:hypothetical protein
MLARHRAGQHDEVAIVVAADRRRGGDRVGAAKAIDDPGHDAPDRTTVAPPAQARGWHEPTR